MWRPCVCVAAHRPHLCPISASVLRTEQSDKQQRNLMKYAASSYWPGPCLHFRHSAVFLSPGIFFVTFPGSQFCSACLCSLFARAGRAFCDHIPHCFIAICGKFAVIPGVLIDFPFRSVKYCVCVLRNVFFSVCNAITGEADERTKAACGMEKCNAPAMTISNDLCERKQNIRVQTRNK